MIFESFNRTCTGTIVTHDGDVVVVFAGNPYGSHNLVAIKGGQAFRHGDGAVLCWLASWEPRLYRRVCAYLYKRGGKYQAFLRQIVPA